MSWRLSSRGWYRLAFFTIATVLLFIAVLLPLAVGSVFDDLVEPPEGSIYPLMPPPGVPPAANTTRLHVSVIGLDELQLRATLRVSGDHLCPNDCSSGTRVVFFSLGTDEAATAGMPPSAKIDLSQSDFVITDTIQLPVRGHPNRYPFDTYDMVLGVALGRLQQDGTVQPQTREQGSGRLVLTVQEQLPRETMDAPTPQDAVAADQEEGTSSPYQFQTLQLLHFSRPLHIRVLAVLLVLLIAAAAAYAVFMRPLTELVVNSGGLVLGVWGIRSILMPNNPPYLTTVDLSLSMVILFLLGAITVRALQFTYRHSGLLVKAPAGGAGGAASGAGGVGPARHRRGPNGRARLASGRRGRARSGRGASS